MAAQADIDKLKLVLGDSGLTDITLGALIDQVAGNLTKAASLAWQRIAADRVTMVNVSEAGSSRSLGDVFNNSLKLAEFNQKASVPALRRNTVVRRIERE
jgi:hypothetical protein